MKLGIYSVCDRRANSYNAPHCAINDAVAIRDFDVTFHSTFDRLSMYSGDLALVKIGVFDTDTGIVEPCDHFVLKSNLPTEE